MVAIATWQALQRCNGVTIVVVVALLRLLLCCRCCCCCCCCCWQAHQSTKPRSTVQKQRGSTLVSSTWEGEHVYCVARHGVMGWDGTGWDGMGRDGMGWDGMCLKLFGHWMARCIHKCVERLFHAGARTLPVTTEFQLLVPVNSSFGHAVEQKTRERDTTHSFKI